ncbi:CAAX prenyl protease 1 [Encephalitozoon intestinalis ATCC 50506]|uniref:CAAX prenyl protease n=1 Tax=Encephalitozoon intestinalis (strain ATCC 50506) TaxID=876142 RepID=E0S5Z6_ENCIT|nr:CAAX prenyl protease 1 [Encephalitozoon intestinalis ATCC 50506]ADM11131.1 CAAX prenyl protease 1 [Encephalitozoon intestinalis ATCC 50506]UTX44785.1 CAAX prenyl protease 1 [Encephalitozoon intestinalis]
MAGNFLLSISIMNYVFMVYLKIRELRQLFKPPSKTYLRLATMDQIKKTKEYNRDKLFMSVFELTILLGRDIYLIKKGVLEEVYSIKYFMNSYYGDTLFLLGFAHFQRLFDLPLDLISTFYIEAKHGFNKTTFPTFLLDFVKMTAIITVIFAPFSHIVMSIIRKYQKTFFCIYLWIFIAIFQIVLVIIYPIAIQPIFNKFEEMEESDLKTKIQELAEKVGFRANKILIMDASKRSGHSNAYFIGITKEKRIVLYDTLLKQANEEEVLAILCHEFGHWKHSHVIKMASMVLLIQLFYLFILNVLMNSRSFGNFILGKDLPLLIRCVYFLMIIGALSVPIDMIKNSVSRYFERQADRFSVSLGYGKELSSGLIKLFEKNSSNMDPDPLYSAVMHTHPTLIERINLIEGEMNKIK